MHASTPWRAAGREPVTVWCRQPVSPNLSTDGIDVLWDFSRSEEGRDLMEGSTGHFVMREIVQDYGHRPRCRAAGLERRLQAVAGGRVTESSGGMPRYGSISTRASWPVQPWLRVEEGRSAVSTLGLP